MELANEYGKEFFEVSAKIGENIEDIFLIISKTVSKKINEGKNDFNAPSNGVGLSEIEEWTQINKSITLLSKNINRNKNNTSQKRG